MGLPFGALAQAPGAATMVSNGYDDNNGGGNDWNYNAQGLRWVSNSTGVSTKSYTFFDKCDQRTSFGSDGLCNSTGDVYSTINFQKSIGMADIELLSDLAPIEIGNRVFRDNNQNGIQDPGEAGIGGVVVTLYDSTGTTALTTVTTASDGTYVFSSDTSRADVTGRNYGVAQLVPNANLVIGVPTTTTISGATWPLTIQDAGSNDAIDSDVSTSTGKTASFALGAAGNNDHTYDIGYFPPYDLALVKVANTASVTANGDDISWTIRVQNQGAYQSGPFSVTDDLPTGTSFNTGLPPTPSVAPAKWRSEPRRRRTWQVC